LVLGENTNKQQTTFFFDFWLAVLVKTQIILFSIKGVAFVVVEGCV